MLSPTELLRVPSHPTRDFPPLSAFQEHTLYCGVSRSGDLIETEDTIQEAKALLIELLAAVKISNYTITEGLGFWEGASETCLILTVISSLPSVAREVQLVGRGYKVGWEQEAVLYVQRPVYCNLL